MKKKVLFIITYLNTGGILRSLQNFLNCYDSSILEVSVFAMVHQGVYKGHLERCELLPSNSIIEASVAHLENQHGVDKIKSIVLKLLDKLSGYYFQKKLFRIVGRSLLKERHYDAIIGFSESLPTVFVSMMVHPNKVGWIHCDYTNYLDVNGGGTEEKIYDCLQHIVCVSKFTRESFLGIYPSMANKTEAIYNIIDDEMMQRKSIETVDVSFNESTFNIVSVGRLDPVKRLSIVPELARKIADVGCKIKWYVIGPKGTDGELQLFNENRKKFDVDGIVVPLGEKTNPYPYIACADLLVNTSISEACPYVINEAKILGIPVVCTDFGSAKEFIEYGVNGYYEPIEKMADRIVWIINNPNERKRLREALSNFKYDNQQILNQIYSLL